MDIKGHTGPPRARRPGRRHPGGVLRLLPARPGQPHLPGDGVLRGRHGDRAARRRAAGRAGQGAGRRASTGSTRPRPARSRPPRSSRPRWSSPVADVLVKLWADLRRRGRDAGRGQPAGQGRRRQRSSPSTARSRSTRTPTSGSPDNAEFADAAADRPAGAEGQGEGPQLRQARRRGRHHRQRRRAGHVHPRRRRLRRRAARRREAGQLPRHRRRRVGRGHGQRPGHHPQRPVRPQSVFVNVFGGITACDAVANGIVGALALLGDEATKPLVVRLDGNNVEEGRRILAEAAHPLVTLVDTMDDAADKAAELANAGA